MSDLEEIERLRRHVAELTERESNALQAESNIARQFLEVQDEWSYDRAAQAELESIRIELELPDQHGTTILAAIRQLTGADESPQVRLLRRRVAELVESEEKAWQTVSKLRVELGTTAGLRRQVAELGAQLEQGRLDDPPRPYVGGLDD